MILSSENVFITARLMESKTSLNICFDSSSEFLLVDRVQSTEKHTFKEWEML